jgi:hypothetical protein
MIFSSVPASSYVVKVACQTQQLHSVDVPTHLVEACKDMREVQHRVTVLIHLVKDIIPEQLDNVPVAGLRPPRIACKSSQESTVKIEKRYKTPYSGLSLMNPNLHKSRTRRAFSNSLKSSFSSRSVALSAMSASTTDHYLRQDSQQRVIQINQHFPSYHIQQLIDRLPVCQHPPRNGKLKIRLYSRGADRPCSLKTRWHFSDPGCTVSRSCPSSFGSWHHS